MTSGVVLICLYGRIFGVEILPKSPLPGYLHIVFSRVWSRLNSHVSLVVERIIDLSSRTSSHIIAQGRGCNLLAAINERLVRLRAWDSWVLLNRWKHNHSVRFESLLTLTARKNILMSWIIHLVVTYRWLKDLWSGITVLIILTVSIVLTCIATPSSSF